ncbi:hypothetical protein AC579_588 [Pseudocercospora musae]|uniref:Uncharacterized protein n=1 Tax=Pseudocercospora musae TaxID=113226 RepID=A0A139ICN1_9PEZI|nr:hypothetical protein AC579_588 [Pseudocercospora musae]
MAPNPIMIPRKPVPQASQIHGNRKDVSKGFSAAVLATSTVVLLCAATSWARRWLYSGAAIETLLLIHGHAHENRILEGAPLWTVLATYNLIYAICSTSWLLHALFVAATYPAIFLTSLNQFPRIANFARRRLRKFLGGQPHFIRDKLALFNLPALEIDTDVDGLFVVRGVTFSFLTLTLIAHGCELGLKLADDIELAIYVDEVTVRFFRRIEIGHVYANAKGGQFEMTFGGLEDDDDDAASEFSVFLDDTPLLRAATAGSKGLTDRPKLRETLTGVSYVRDSSARAGLDIVTALDPDDEAADKQYHEKLTEIRTSSAVYQSRQAVRQRAKGQGRRLDDEKDMRAAVCAELHSLPSVPHPPSRSVRVTTLQNLSPPHVRRFLHRLPFLLRLLLAPLSYFHSIDISSINAAGSGQWLQMLLQEQVFKQYAENSAELRRLYRKVSTWLTDANFCVQLADIEGLGQVPLSSTFDIVTYLKFSDVMAYRTTLVDGQPQNDSIKQVVRLGGADATFTIPSYLLPHHEHLLPAKPTKEDEEELEQEIGQADGAPKMVQAEHKLEQAQKDETNIFLSVHASLPVSCDQNMLNFVAALVKATKIIEMEKEVDAADRADTPMSPTFSDSTSDGLSRVTSMDEEHSVADSEKVSLKEVAGFKVFAKNIRQNLQDGTTKAKIREFAKDLHQTTKDGMKKTIVGGLVNDRWIAKMVGKVAATLQKAQGDVGYSGSIPLPLEPYRALWTEEGKLSKLLP